MNAEDETMLDIRIEEDYSTEDDEIQDNEWKSELSGEDVINNDLEFEHSDLDDSLHSEEWMGENTTNEEEEAPKALEKWATTIVDPISQESIMRVVYE